MWKNMRDPAIIMAAVLSLGLTYPVCWLLVYKGGWRNDNWAGVSGPASAHDSLTAYLLWANILLACLLSPLLAGYRFVRRVQQQDARPGDTAS